METYKLNEETNSLVQQPEMVKPDFYKWSSGTDSTLFYDLIDKYEAHIASLKTYPISGIVPPEWKDKELKKERDWEKVVVCEHGQRCECTNSEAERCLYSKFVAVPIEQPKEESQQDEYWEEIFDIVNSPLDNQQLKNKFFIQRININK